MKDGGGDLAYSAEHSVCILELSEEKDNKTHHSSDA
jgi:hypothetical protein